MLNYGKWHITEENRAAIDRRGDTHAYTTVRHKHIEDMNEKPTTNTDTVGNPCTTFTAQIESSVHAFLYGIKPDASATGLKQFFH